MPQLANSRINHNLRLEDKLSRPLFAKDYLEDAAFYLLLATIFLAAIPFGTVDLWSKSSLVAIICIIAIIRVTNIFFNGSGLFSNGSLIFPLAGLLGLAIIQITPLPITGNAMTVDPDSTKNFIFIFSGLIIAAEILFAYTTTQKRLKGLIYLVLAVGLGSAFFGFLRIFLFKDSQTGISTYFYIGSGFAQFINRNHFLYLMEMTIGLLLGFIIKGNLTEKQKFLGWVSTGFLILMSISANSRGGLISLTGIFILAAIIYFLTRNRKLEPENRIIKNEMIRKVLLATVLGCAVFALIVVIIAFVGGDAVATRMEKIQEEVVQKDEHTINRLAIWKSTLELIKEKPLFGAGFGGYSAAITKFDNTSGKMSLQQAHNDYLEILANGGIFALLLILIFAYIFISKALKQFKSRNYLRRASCFGAILGILGVVIHSLVDFGLHALINALIFIVLIVIATAKISSSDKPLKFVS